MADICDSCERMAKLEVRVDTHDQLLPQIITKLDDVTSNLKAIKWGILSALLTALAHQFGLLEVLKGILT